MRGLELMWLGGSLDGIKNAKSCKPALSTLFFFFLANYETSTYPDVSEGSLETILFRRLRTFGLGWISDPWSLQTNKLETSSKRRRNGVTAGSTRVYTASALKHAHIAWWARLGVRAVGIIAKHCNSVIPP